MKVIPHLPNIALSKEQGAWLKETWRLLKESGNNPSYKAIRLNTMKDTGEDFDPSTIDQRLLKEKSTQITLLGVLHIEPDTNILEDIDKIILAIRKRLLDDTNQEDFMIGEIASEIVLDKGYSQIIFSLASMYGSFWSSASSQTAINSPYGYERFSIKHEQTFDAYIKFKSISQLMEDYYKRQEEYDKKSKEDFSIPKGRFASKLFKSSSFTLERENKIATLFSLEIFKDTRGYIQEIANQASLCYSYGLYDASLVMIRKLCETLIIEAFERYEAEEKILDKDGNYVTLNYLIGYFLAEPSWNLGRNTKSGLPKLKKLADASAHNRRFSARKEDIDSLEELRILIQEIINIIDYSSWKKSPPKNQGKNKLQPKSHIFRLLPTSHIIDTGIDVHFGEFIKGEIDLSNPFHIDTSQNFPWMDDFTLRYKNQGKWIDHVKYISPSGMKTYDENGNQIVFEHPEVVYSTWGAIYMQVDSKKYRIESLSIKNSLINTPSNSEMKPLLMETSGRLFIHVNPHPYIEGTAGEIEVKIEKS